MPYVSVRLIEGISAEEKARVVSGMTRVLVDVLQKNPETTFVVIDEVPTDNWGLGGKTVTTRRRLKAGSPALPARALCHAVGLRSMLAGRQASLAGAQVPENAEEPMEVSYEYGAVDPSIFDDPATGLGRWAPLLPAFDRASLLGEGDTPLLRSERLAEWAGVDTLWLKLECCNPTGSHKDRFNAVAVSGAQQRGYAGVALATMGNHGVSAAAYAARVGIPCVVLIAEDCPGLVQEQLRALGAAAIAIPWSERFDALKRICATHGYWPLSSTSADHINGDPYGPEGYKTIAYELQRQLDGSEASSVYVPSGHSELLFGLQKGFTELVMFGRRAAPPLLVACEPAARAPLSRAIASGRLVARVAAEPTDASSIGVCVNSLRGALTLRQNGGAVATVSDDEMRLAQRELLREGIWAELSGCASLAALRQRARTQSSREKAVCLITGAAYRSTRASCQAPKSPAAHADLARTLAEHYGLQPRVRARGVAEGMSFQTGEPRNPPPGAGDHG